MLISSKLTKTFLIYMYFFQLYLNKNKLKYVSAISYLIRRLLAFHALHCLSLSSISLSILAPVPWLLFHSLRVTPFVTSSSMMITSNTSYSLFLGSSRSPFSETSCHCLSIHAWYDLAININYHISPKNTMWMQSL